MQKNMGDDMRTQMSKELELSEKLKRLKTSALSKKTILKLVFGFSMLAFVGIIAILLFAFPLGLYTPVAGVQKEVALKLTDVLKFKKNELIGVAMVLVPAAIVLLIFVIKLLASMTTIFSGGQNAEVYRLVREKKSLGQLMLFSFLFLILTPFHINLAAVTSIYENGDMTKDGYFLANKGWGSISDKLFATAPGLIFVFAFVFFVILTVLYYTLFVIPRRKIDTLCAVNGIHNPPSGITYLDKTLGTLNVPNYAENRGLAKRGLGYTFIALNQGVLLALLGIFVFMPGGLFTSLILGMLDGAAAGYSTAIPYEVSFRTFVRVICGESPFLDMSLFGQIQQNIILNGFNFKDLTNLLEDWFSLKGMTDAAKENGWLWLILGVVFDFASLIACVECFIKLIKAMLPKFGRISMTVCGRPFINDCKEYTQSMRRVFVNSLVCLVLFTTANYCYVRLLGGKDADFPKVYNALAILVGVSFVMLIINAIMGKLLPADNLSPMPSQWINQAYGGTGGMGQMGNMGMGQNMGPGYMNPTGGMPAGTFNAGYANNYGGGVPPANPYAGMYPGNAGYPPNPGTPGAGMPGAGMPGGYFPPNNNNNNGQ